MKKILINILFLFVINNFVFGETKNVSDTWAGVKKYIAVNAGTAKESWESSANAIITNGAAEMEPVGDGTFQKVLELTPGATYNYMFFAKTESTPPSGLKPNQTYWDCVPNAGGIACGTDATNPQVWDTSVELPARFGGVGERSDNARRILTVPDYLTENDTFYVFNNFSSIPGLVKNLKAEAKDTTSVLLSWEAPYGYWGNDMEEKKAADVIAGGTYAILRYINDDTSTYQVIAQVPGNQFSYIDDNNGAGLNPDWWYWYVVVPYDAYLGNPGSAFEQGTSSWDEDDSDSAIPRPPVRIWLKVENMDYDYIRKNEYIVYLTPSNCKNKYFTKRYKGRIINIKL